MIRSLVGPKGVLGLGLLPMYVLYKLSLSRARYVHTQSYRFTFVALKKISLGTECGHVFERNET